MKKLLLIPVLLLAVIAFAQNGYEIKVTLKPFKNEYIYLGHYSGKQYPIVDSVKLNDKSEGIFKGAKKLGGGIYLIAYPGKNNFFEILVDKQQHFSVIADTATVKKEKNFVNSSDNILFSTYQAYMAEKGKTVESARKKLAAAATAKDSAYWNDQLKKMDSTVAVFRKNVIAKNPDNILSALLHLTTEPVIPAADKHPGGKYDSTFAWRYFKHHYWDGINFWDDRITRTPASLFDERLDKYYNTLVSLQPDSVIKEIDWMLGYASISEEMTRFLLVKFVNRYLTQKYMWEDAVFVHLYQKYFSQKEYSWLTPQGKKIITDRAYSLMANIMGNHAENISLPDTSGKTVSLYTIEANYTIVAFWDPTCSHCKEIIPKLDSIYQKRWKGMGLQIFALAKETDGSIIDWFNFIRENNLSDWTHVYYSRIYERARIAANVPGYSQLYDIQSFPTLYLLDKEKRIVAKKLTLEQIDEILKLKDPDGYSKATSSEKKRVSPPIMPKPSEIKPSEIIPTPNLDNSYYNSFGTGILIDTKNNYVLTNYHVVKGAKIVSVQFFTNDINPPKEFFGTVIKSDENNDIALIKILNKKSFDNIPFSISNKQEELATKVFTLGYPVSDILGPDIKVTDGIISSKNGMGGNVNYYQHTAPISHGSSGGPLFNEKGILIGINSLGITDKTIIENVAFSIKSSTIINFLSNAGIDISRYILPKNSLNKSFITLVNEYSKYIPFIRIKY